MTPPPDAALAAMPASASSLEPHPYPSRAIVGSRRLTGANLYSPKSGAVLEVTVAPQDIEARLDAWCRVIHDILGRIGWQDEIIVVRCNPVTGRGGGFLSAPVDGLLAATEVNEQAWLAMEQTQSGSTPDYDDIAARLRVFILHDRRPMLTTLVDDAHVRNLSVTLDDDHITIGAGAGSRTWPLAKLPDLAEVSWGELHNIPIALVTGSNGKTTTTRLLANMLQRAGYLPGWSCTDGVWVGSDIVAEGDYAGPAGARLIVRDSRVTAAVLETARGGILRRGLAVERAHVAIVTNVADDHLGEYGVDDLRSLGETKLVVASAVPPSGRVVLNADDRTLRALARSVAAPITWFSAQGTPESIAEVRSLGQDAFVLEEQSLIAITNAQRQLLVHAHELPLSLGGAMRYNIANALAASAAAFAMGISIEDVRETLRNFGSSVSDNPGRLATLTLRGARLLVDFVHNPDGWDAIRKGLAHIPGRRLVVVGQAGDRDTRALHALAESAWRLAPELVVLKEMPSYLRGRPLGETTEILAAAFHDLGAPPESLLRADDELAAVDLVIENALAGDLIILGVHDDFDAAIARLHQRGAVTERWT